MDRYFATGMGAGIILSAVSGFGAMAFGVPEFQAVIFGGLTGILPAAKWLDGSRPRPSLAYNGGATLGTLLGCLIVAVGSTT